MVPIKVVRMVLFIIGKKIIISAQGKIPFTKAFNDYRTEQKERI